MRTRRSLVLAACVFAVLAACVIAVLAVLSAMLFAAMTTPRGCDGVDAETLNPEQSGQLVARGWYGDPGDNAENLYPPQCFPRSEQASPSEYTGDLTPASGV